MSLRALSVLRASRSLTRQRCGIRHISNALSKTCASCSAPLPTPLPACPKCRFISPVSPEVPKHELFGMPYEPNPFDVDTAALRQRFRDLQRVVHPDLWSGSDKQDVALQLSSYVNESFKTLSRPVLRAEYILSRNDIHPSETEHLDDPAFIMEIMDAREELEQASSREEVEPIAADVQEKVQATSQRLSTLVEGRQWEDVKREAIRLKYLEGIAEAARVWPETSSDH